MSRKPLFQTYQELQSYVGWTAEDSRRMISVRGDVDGHLPILIDDFYAEIERHLDVRGFFSGDRSQLDRLKYSLLEWIRALFSGRYDESFVETRWQVGRRHLEIGLKKVYTNAAMSRLRTRLVQAVRATWSGDLHELDDVLESLHKLLDLDQALIEDSYETEFRARLDRAEQERLAHLKKQSEETFRTLVEAADCVIVIVRPDYSIAYFSPYAERLTGYSAEELLTRDYLKLFVPDDDQPRIIDEVARVFSEGASNGFESTLICRDGSRRWLTWNARVIADFQGAPGILGVGYDITHVKKEQELALQTEHLAAVGKMVGGLAHQCRNALQRSQACLEMLVLTVRDRPESLDLIARMQRAQDHLIEVYEGVRRYAEPMTFNFRSCDLREVWREAWARLEPLREGIDAELVERADGMDLRCRADPDRLGRVFYKLFDNSLAASSPPVRIEIIAEDIKVEGRICLRIGVRDNGPGIPSDVKNRVFEPFFTTKTQGTGLSLAIVTRIVEAHGGRITVVDDGGPGALFEITLQREMR